MTTYQHDTVVPFKDSEESKKQQVEKMFDRIAYRYDFLNHFLSAGIDIGWRKKAIKQLRPLDPKSILDVATGTADMAILASKLLKVDKIVGIDISEGMLDIGKKKIERLGLQQRIELLKGDSETIIFNSNSFDAVTVAFGVRNFQDLELGLSEIKRVLKPRGKLIVLECTKPKLPVIKNFYNLYLNLIAPWIGRVISKNKNAYQYLNESVQKFPEGNDFVQILNKLGYKNASCKTLSLGISSIYSGEK
ncbi:MAG TPA: bifunctional demethylmenaquinone methyltransferase/2-methoxy-6-polyprenyl-1,4-benzoquinol methylase UbiE [Chitinophagaceae bacterium]|nr:bifunctional demethylmenaquinone methyltransferase/2-methoxy-6-polyprenyl-1,4-benzoquinol methylase UbiE [Chitinophagaceae bacterium]